VSPVRYKLGFYIPEDDILHSHCRENLKSYTILILHIYNCDFQTNHSTGPIQVELLKGLSSSPVEIKNDRCYIRSRPALGLTQPLIQWVQG
jgi:hypothetical protein